MKSILRRGFVGMTMLAVPLAFCRCDEGGGLHGTAPRVDQYYMGSAESAPAVKDFLAMPDNSDVSIDFGVVDNDSMVVRYVFFKNTGQASLALNKVSFAEGSSEDFWIACLDNGRYVDRCPYGADNPLKIDAGANLLIKVSFLPRQVGHKEASFVLSSNAAQRGEITVRLLGEGVTPEIQVCINDCVGDQDGTACGSAPEICSDQKPGGGLSIDFGKAGLGDRIKRRVTVRNKSELPLQVSIFNFQDGDFSQFELSSGSQLPGELTGGASTTATITYVPGMGGEHHANFQIVSNDSTQREIKIVLKGQAMAPRLCPSPQLVDFGTVNVGEAPLQSIAISNCGLSDLILHQVLLHQGTGFDPQFTLPSPPPADQTLTPGQTLAVQVQYQPTASGWNHGGVDLFSNDPASGANSLTGMVGLKGFGRVPVCEIQVTPVVVFFGSVVINNPQITDLVISNQGTAKCTFKNASISSNTPEFTILQKPADNTDFMPGDTLPLRLQYLPTVVGVDTGTLSIFGNDNDGEEIRVDLNGEALLTATCDLQVLPTKLNFGTVKLHNSQVMTVQLTNRGQAPCQISRVEFKQSMLNPSDFSLSNPPSLPLTLGIRGQPDAQAQISVTFTPEELDLHSGTLWVTSNDPDLQLNSDPFSCWPSPSKGQACIAVTGFSAESNIEVVPASIDFGVVTLGCNSAQQHVTVYNLGTIAINIQDIHLEDPADPNFEILSAPTVPFALNGGRNFQVLLRYHPQDANAHSAALDILSDASNVATLAVPLSGQGTTIADQTDTFSQPSDVKADVLFVVDNSGSMEWAQDQLVQNFGSFIEWATTLQVDFHIGVIATEVNQAEDNLGSPPRRIEPGVLVQAGDGPKILTNQTPDLHQAFSDNAHLGLCCSDEQEAGMQAAWMALTPPLVNDPAKNGGFLREEAKLYIICLSDEQDQSRGDPDFYTDFFKSIKGPRNTGMMKMSAIVGSCPDGCEGGGISSTQVECGSRYIEVANGTGGLFEDICLGDWAGSLEALGIDAFDPKREFGLSRPASETTLEVKVNGRVVNQASSPGGADGWTYYSDTNSIFFGDSVVPGRGESIEVHYTTVCL